MGEESSPTIGDAVEMDNRNPADANLVEEEVVAVAPPPTRRSNVKEVVDDRTNLDVNMIRYCC